MKHYKPFLALVGLLTLLTSCSGSSSDNPVDEPVLNGIISWYNEYSGAMLDITAADMDAAGYTLGDVISLTLDGEELVMPYYDGYYTENAEYLCVAYPGYTSVCFTANNTGLPQRLLGLDGHAVTIKMKVAASTCKRPWACITPTTAVSIPTSQMQSLPMRAS